MASAILMQVVHDPHKYTAEVLMRQAAMHMLRNPYRYYEALETVLIRTGKGYKSYVYNLFHRNILGDDLIAAVIGDMWNIAISIVTPIHKKPVALFHNKDVPDVVIVANGGDYMSNDGSTHFSATRCYEEGFKLPGSEYRNPTLAQDLSSKLAPIILDDPRKATQVACRNFIKIDEERSLKLLRGLCENINRLDDTVCELIRQGEEVRQQKSFMEYQMEQIGINCEKIKEATAILNEDRGYVRTADREKYDLEMEKKRKAQEQLRQEEEKRLKTITAREEGEEPKEKSDEDHGSILARQQQEIIRQQEALLQKQEKHMEEQERRIRLMELGQEKRAEESQQIQPRQFHSVQKPSTSTGAGTIDKYLRPSALKFLPCVKKEKEAEEEEEQEDEEVMITSVTEPTQPTRYIPKVVPGVENLVLMEVQKPKGVGRRSAKGPPVPKAKQDPMRFYCDSCDSHYNRHDELVRHKKKDCGKVDPEYFCDECGKPFLKENGVREHYYHQHTDITLWFCQKCGEGFHFKSNQSKHLKTCPQRNGPDKYVRRAPYDATIEATFKKRAAVPLQVVPQQGAAANPQQQAVVNPALVIQPDDPDPENPEPQRTQDPMETEKTPYEEEAKKVVENIEGEALLNMMAKGIIPDSRKVDAGDSEAKPEIDVEMHFDDD